MRKPSMLVTMLALSMGALAMEETAVREKRLPRPERDEGKLEAAKGKRAKKAAKRARMLARNSQLPPPDTL